jgi:hypothetical protein
MPDNIWVDEIQGFRERNLEMFQAFDAIGAALLRAIARALALPVDYFADKVQEGNSVLRVIHYPPMPPNPTESVRAGAHEDINVITLLMGAEEPGLQVLSKQGEWLVRESAAGLARGERRRHAAAAQQRRAALDHASGRQSGARARQQRALFDAVFPALQPGFPDRNPARLHCTGTRPNLYPDAITADDYLQQRLREIKLK